MPLYAEFGECHVVAVYTHVLEVRGSKEWFQEDQRQEILECLPEVLRVKATSLSLVPWRKEHTTAAAKKDKSSSSLQFKKSDNLRMLFSFQVDENRQHIVQFSQCNKCELIGGTAFMSDHGRRVLPYLSELPSARQGECKSYKVFREALHVYVDTLEVNSAEGVIKVLYQLQPSHKRSLDVASYFTGQFSDEPSSKRIKPIIKSRKLVTRKKQSPQQRNTLSQAFAQTPSKDILDIPSSAIDEMFDFDSPGCSTEIRDNPVIREIEDNENRSAIKENKAVVDGGAPVGLPLNEIPPDDVSFSDDSNCSLYMNVQTPTASDDKPHTPISPSTGGVASIGSISGDLVSPEPHTDADTSHLEATSCAPSSNPSFLGSSPKHGTSYSHCEASPPSGRSNPSFTVSKLSAGGRSTVSKPKPRTDTTISHHKASPPPSPSLSDSRPSSAMSGLSSPPSARSSPSFSYSRPSPAKCGSLPNTEMEALHEITNVASSTSSHSLESCHSDIVAVLDNTDEVQLACDQQLEDVVLVKVSPKKKWKTKSPQEIFGDTEAMADLSTFQIRCWVKTKRDLLVAMFQSKVPSQRHDQFMQGPKSKAKLKFQADTRMLTPPQAKAMIDILLAFFCSRHSKFFNYVMSVLLPECVIRIIADFHGVEYDKAEAMMLHYDEDEHPVVID